MQCNVMCRARLLPPARCCARFIAVAHLRAAVWPVQLRMGAFRKLLEGKPHKVIVCIGHSTFFREFSSGGRGKRMLNCELHTQYL